MSHAPIPAGAGPATTARPDVTLSEHLPALLVSLLERRYLATVPAGGWGLWPVTADEARPLLAEVLALGRPSDPSAGAAMPYALAACHDAGHALVMVLHGGETDQGHRHRLYFGARRLPGGGSTQDYLRAQSSAFRAHFPGLQLGPERPLGEGGLTELAAFLRTAPALAAVTGIPSGRGGPTPLESQGLDRLVRSVGTQKYALLVVAEPLAPEVIDATLDVCRRLQGEISSYIQQSITRGKGGGQTVTRPEPAAGPKGPALDQKLPAYLQRLESFFNFALHTPWGAGFALAGSLVADVMGTGRAAQAPAPQVSQADNWSESATVTLLDANARACDQLLQQYTDRLRKARSGGWWRVAVYLAGESEAALACVSQALRSLCGGDATALEPLRSLPLPAPLLRDALLHGHVLGLRPAGGGPGNPLGEAFDAVATCLTSDELSVLVNLPRREIPGLPMRDHGDFAATAPAPPPDSIPLGRLRDALGHDLGPVRVSARALNEHVLVTGTPGSGKTNTCMQLLVRTALELGRPFLVLEPAKAEYRRLAGVPGLRDRLRVYAVGGGDGLPLRLNPFAPVKGAPLAGHLDLLKAVFNASFAMFAGMPQVLEQALVEVYEERGWNLYTGGNDALGPDPSPEEESAVTPCLADLHDQIEVVLNKKGYSQEVHRNLGAALRSRLNGLMLGSKGMALNTRRSTPLADLFEAPAVIELQYLRDDEEKSFVMALLFMLLYQYAEVRQQGLPPERRERLQHLTLIEEAHRLLSAPRGGASPETGDPRGKAVSMFTDMLAEMRALGEGFVIAEQIPTKLAPETLKNTNLKIIHRLTAPSERLAAGQSVNLTDAQLRYLTSLPRGLAVVHGLSNDTDEPIADAVLVQVHPFKDAWVGAGPSAGGREAAPADGRSHLLRHEGCRACPSPCDFFPRVEGRLRRQGPDARFRRFLEALLTGDDARSWAEWSDWRARQRAESGARSEGEEATAAGTTFCAAVQEAYDWLGTVLAARAREPRGPARLRPRDRLRREELARDLGPLLLAWASLDELTDAARATFRETRRRLADALLEHAEAPRLDGCARCPARCRSLPYVAPLDLARVAQQLRAALAGRKSAKARWALVREALQTIERDLPLLARGGEGLPSRWHWRYCLLTNLELDGEAAAARDELLALIGEPSAAVLLEDDLASLR